MDGHILHLLAVMHDIYLICITVEGFLRRLQRETYRRPVNDAGRALIGRTLFNVKYTVV